MDSYSLVRPSVAARGWHARGILFGLIVISTIVAARGDSRAVRIADRTDWWSINNEDFHRQDIKPRNENIASKTLEIADVPLGHHQFEKLATRFGSAPIVQRGDASTGRQQVCYVAHEGSGNVYLIFEFGEDQSVFYLFSDGAPWNGRELCVRTNQKSMGPETGSGLRLGLPLDQVEAILGKADAAYGESLVYYRQLQQKTTPVEFDRLRKEYPEQLSDAVAHQQFDYYSVEIYVEARFGKSGLKYLAVSKSNGID
jgi:hypothetical protein